MERLRERFDALNVSLNQALSIIKEPSKMILAELDEQMKERVHSAATIQKTVIELIRQSTADTKRRVMPGTVYELSTAETDLATKMMRALSPLLVDACDNHEQTQKLNHTVATLRQSDETERSPEQAYLLVKYVHLIWDLAASVNAKIELIKMTQTGSIEHIDCLTDARRICDEMDDAINWVEAHDIVNMAKFVHPYRQTLVDWCTIMEEMRLISLAPFRI